MKKRMLALAMALMLAVSCFAAFPASAEGESLTWSITSSETVTPGDLLNVKVSLNASNPVEGFLLELVLPAGVTLAIPEGQELGEDIYLSELFKDAPNAGFYVNKLTGTTSETYRFVYAGFSENGTIVDPQPAIAVGGVDLFNFDVNVSSDLLDSTIAIAQITLGDAAYKVDNSYVKFPEATQVITQVTVANPAPTTITSEEYYINEDTHLIYGVAPATTITDFIANTSLGDEGAPEATFTMFDGATLIPSEDYEGTYVGTGMIIQVGDLTYAAVVFGEIDGYGEISDAGGFTIVNLAYGFTSISEIMSGMGYTGEEDNYSLIESAINVAADPYYEGINDGTGFAMVNYAYFGEVSLDYETLRTDGILIYQEVLAV